VAPGFQYQLGIHLVPAYQVWCR